MVTLDQNERKMALYAMLVFSSLTVVLFRPSEDLATASVQNITRPSGVSANNVLKLYLKCMRTAGNFEVAMHWPSQF